VRVVASSPAMLSGAPGIGLYLVYRRSMRSHPGQWRSPVPTTGIVAASSASTRSSGASPTFR
jgi:hypothetical protein